MAGDPMTGNTVHSNYLFVGTTTVTTTTLTTTSKFFVDVSNASTSMLFSVSDHVFVSNVRVKKFNHYMHTQFDP